MTRAVAFSIIQTGALSNGGLRSITEVMMRLKRHRAVVLTNLESDATDEWRRLGIEVHVEAERASAGLWNAPLGYAAAYWRWHRALRRTIRESRARVVHANDPLAFQLSLSAAKASGARIILNVRDTLAPGRRPPRLKYSLLFAGADHVLYLSNDMRTRWREVTPNATRSCSVTYSIVDPTRFAPSPIEAGREPVVIVSGIFWPKKGQLDFIRKVVPTLTEAGVKTWFAGDFDPAHSQYARECATAAESFGNAVEFLGHRSDMPELLRQVRVVAVPSRHEGLVRGMVEAMACGRPVASFDVCSAREILEREACGAGVVVNAGDFARMAEAILSYCRDPGAASEAGARGSAASARLFAPDAVVARYEQVYERLGSTHEAHR